MTIKIKTVRMGKKQLETLKANLEFESKKEQKTKKLKRLKKVATKQNTLGAMFPQLKKLR